MSRIANVQSRQVLHKNNEPRNEREEPWGEGPRFRVRETAERPSEAFANPAVHEPHRSGIEAPATGTDCRWRRTGTVRRRSLPIRGMFAFLLLLVLGGCQRDVAKKDGKKTGGERPEAQTKQDSPDPESLSDPVMLSPEELADGWISLFDGQTRFGWKHQDTETWRVENGALVAENGENSLLATSTEFSDYLLKLEFRSEPDTESGVFLSTKLNPVDKTTDCYHLSIAGMESPFPTGSLVDREAVDENLNRSEWQSYEVRVEQGRVVVKLDGKQVLDYADPDPIARGHVALQLNEGRIEFRDIQLKPLGTESIFNGENLDGWKTYPEMESEFSVDPEQEVLNVVDGPGQLETEKTYGDFVLQLECITHAPNLNSGIFFRCIPGETMNGYESQIHNGYEEGDRAQPTDCGTGGIFRRQDARWVAADDEEWFYKTIIAHGPHMAVWVNGLQVSDWTDTREPDPNPRRGLRLEPGTIMIQGHDPTTDLSFRNLRIAEMR